MKKNIVVGLVFSALHILYIWIWWVSTHEFPKSIGGVSNLYATPCIFALGWFLSWLVRRSGNSEAFTANAVGPILITPLGPFAAPVCFLIFMYYVSKGSLPQDLLVVAGVIISATAYCMLFSSNNALSVFDTPAVKSRTGKHFLFFCFFATFHCLCACFLLGAWGMAIAFAMAIILLPITYFYSRRMRFYADCGIPLSA